jgi:hypothetical protein
MRETPKPFGHRRLGETMSAFGALQDFSSWIAPAELAYAAYAYTWLGRRTPFETIGDA